MLVRLQTRLGRLEKRVLQRPERRRGEWDYAALSDDELRRMAGLIESAGYGLDGGINYARLGEREMTELRGLEQKLVWRPG